MLDRDDLTLAVAGALVAAVLIGWVLCWLVGRINRGGGQRGIARTAELAARLHLAEEAQATAQIRLAEVESDMNQRLAEMQGELDSTLASLARARAQTEEVRAAYRKAMAERGAGPA